MSLQAELNKIIKEGDTVLSGKASQILLTAQEFCHWNWRYNVIGFQTSLYALEEKGYDKKKTKKVKEMLTEIINKLNEVEELCR